MSDIDPIAFGRLQSQVESLTSEVEDMRADIKTLLGMAERSKGALWLGMTLASVLGGIVTWVATHWVSKGP